MCTAHTSHDLAQPEALSHPEHRAGLAWGTVKAVQRARVHAHAEAHAAVHPLRHAPTQAHAVTMGPYPALPWGGTVRKGGRTPTLTTWRSKAKTNAKASPFASPSGSTNASAPRVTYPYLAGMALGWAGQK